MNKENDCKDVKSPAWTSPSAATACRRMTYRKYLAAMMILPISLTPTPIVLAQDRSDIDRFIREMNFDARSILSVHTPNNSESIPSRHEDANQVTVCTAEDSNAEGESGNISILSPTAGVIYPGALVRVNRALAEGQPQALQSPRAPVTFRLDLPGQRNGTARVEKPSASSIQTAMDNILIDWIEAKPTHGFATPARHTLNVQRAYSQGQVTATLGLNARWMSNSITANIRGSSNRETKTHIALFRQIYYSAIADLPQNPSAVFAPQVTLASLRKQINNSNPPGFVRSVDYGRQILIRMDTDHSVRDADIEGTLRYAAGGNVSVDSQTKLTYQNIASNARISVLVVGGNAQDATNVNGMAGLQQIMSAGAAFGRLNPGVPISYAVTFLRDHGVAAMRFTADYTQWSCRTRPNIALHLHHTGGYVARFEVTWQEKDASQRVVSRSWRSGPQTAGWRYTRRFPGDADNFRIQAYAQTGLVWNPWAQVMNEQPANTADGRWCFRTFGAVTNPRFDTHCP